MESVSLVLMVYIGGILWLPFVRYRLFRFGKINL
jgi:hypothetical protein